MMNENKVGSAGRFEGRTILVTGGGSGIGAATCRQLAREGAGRVIVVDIDNVSAEAVASDVGGSAYRVDVSDPADVEALFDTASSDVGPVDVVVHAAGVDDPEAKRMMLESVEAGEALDALCRLTDDRWSRVLRINLDGTFHVLRSAVSRMRATGGGSIVTVGSSAAFDTLSGYPHYAASKSGVHALSQAVAKEAIAWGIRVNTVAPGPVDTPMASRTPAVMRQRMSGPGPVGYATPEELSESICYLASNQASNVVGAVLLSNGGRFTV